MKPKGSETWKKRFTQDETDFLLAELERIKNNKPFDANINQSIFKQITEPAEPKVLGRRKLAKVNGKTS